MNDRAPSNNSVSLDDEAVASAAQAGVVLLQLDSTVAPTKMSGQINVLRVILQALARGDVMLASPAPPPVESNRAAEAPIERPADENYTDKETSNGR